MKKLLLAAATLAATVPAISHAATETLYVNDTNARRGDLSSQNINVLNDQEMSGSSDNWSTYLEASPDNNRFIGFFDFYASTRTGWNSLTLNTNTIGEAKSAQHWTFQIRDNVNRRWVKVGDNTGATDWVWYEQALNLEGSISNYINSKGRVRVRYISNNAADVSNIDQLVLNLHKPDEPVGDGDWWKPTPTQELTWQWQINGELDTSYNVDMYDVDLFDTSAAQIAAIKNTDKIVTCYFSAGTYEGWRSDWAENFSFISGEEYSGSNAPFAGNMSEWDERWLDIRRTDLLEGIMGSRMDLAVEKGCDAVEPDNMDAYTNGSETGIALTAQDQLNYNRWIANLAHERGLSVGLKNDVDQLAELVDDFDWALNEQCFQYNECDGYQVFINAGKAVFGVEYQGSASTFCPKANTQGLYWLKKNLALDAWRLGCEDY